MIVKETCKKIVTWFLLVCNVFTLIPLTVFADTTPSKGEIKDPVVEAGKLEEDGDIQIIKTVTKVNDTGKYNVSFTVKGMPVEEPKESVKPIYVAVVFDRSGSMYCSNGTTTHPSLGSSTKVATINGQDIYCESKRDVYKDKWAKAVNGAIDFSKDLVAKSDTYVSLVTFASSASKATEFSRNAFTEKDFGYPNGGTDLAGGIKAATEALNTVEGDVQKFILVIGDGEPTFYYGQREWCGWGECTTYPNSTSAAKNEANTAKTSKIKIFSVGYGVSKNSNAEKILMAISSNKDKDNKYYISASTSGISEALNTVVKEMNTIAAGKNATLKDTIGGQFTYVSSNNENVKNNGDVVTYKIDEITEEGITFDFDIQIKEETPTGWYDTNDFANNGVILEYTDAYGKTKTISFDKSSKVYWVGNKYDYTINYYKNSISEGNHLGTVSGAAEYNETITADTTKYLPEGYKFVGEAPSMIIKTEGNNIDVIYVKDTFNYVINYYKDSKSDDNYLGNVSDSALYGDKIVADTTKYLPEGYKFVGVEPSMVIKTNGNVIDVIYTKENYNYTVNYYKDSISLENHLGTVSKSALYGDEIIADTTKYLPEGYKFVGEAPSMIIKTEGNNIDVIYVKKELIYTVEYYFDDIIDEQLTEEYTALYGDVISEYVDKTKENYILDINNPVNVPLVISEKDNVIKVYYVYDEGEIIPPYTGSTDNGLFNLLFFLASVLIITKINLKTKEN